MLPDEITQLKDEQIDLLTIRNRWNLRGYAVMVTAMDFLLLKLKDKLTELQEGKE